MITGIILASGFSKRLGKEKLLLDINGMKMIDKVIESSKRSDLDEIILIYRKEEIKLRGEKYNIKTLYNPNAHLGQSEAVKLGVREAKDSNAYMFIVGDQPFINSNLINNLISEYKKNKEFIIIPDYSGRNGTPTIFPSIYRNELLNITGDKGGRDILEKYPRKIRKVSIDRNLGLDIDTFEDYQLIKNEI